MVVFVLATDISVDLAMVQEMLEKRMKLVVFVVSTTIRENC